MPRLAAVTQPSAATPNIARIRGARAREAAMARCAATRTVGRVVRIDVASVGELVADAVHGQEVPRTSRIRFELAPDVLDVGVDRAIERVDLDAADGVEQLRAREHPARLAGERREQLEFGPGQVEAIEVRQAQVEDVRSGRRDRAIASASGPVAAIVTVNPALEVVPRNLRNPRLIVHDEDVLPS